MNQTNRKCFNMAGKVCVLLANALLVAACGSGGGDDDAQEVADRGRGNGPQFSLDIEAFCGDPVAIEYDEDMNPLGTFAQNVAVRLTDVSDDNGPAGADVGLVTIECLAAVKPEGGGKPDQVNFATILIPDPGFGITDATCPLGSLPAGATEWKASATASGGTVRRDVSDSCEEVPVQ
jgi:hypothetical protein